MEIRPMEAVILFYTSKYFPTQFHYFPKINQHTTLRDHKVMVKLR